MHESSHLKSIFFEQAIITLISTCLVLCHTLNAAPIHNNATHLKLQPNI